MTLLLAAALCDRITIGEAIEMVAGVVALLAILAFLAFLVWLVNDC